MPPLVIAKLIPPSKTFYIQGLQGADPALPPEPVLVAALFRPEDFLWLTVNIWRKSGDEGFIAFNFLPQHVVESDSVVESVDGKEAIRSPKGAVNPNPSPKNDPVPEDVLKTFPPDLQRQVVERDNQHFDYQYF